MDHTPRFIREFLGDAPLSDIVACELRERDIDETFVLLRRRDGEELRLACPADEAEVYVRTIKGWLARPSTFPDPGPSLPSPRVLWALSWLVFGLACLVLAWRGTTRYWIVSGWALLSLLPWLLLAATAACALFLKTVSPNPFRASWLALGSPLVLFVALVFSAAAKAVNAEFGAQREVSIRGPVLSLRDGSFTAYFVSKGRSPSSVPISRQFALVRDDATGREFSVEVPGWVAERHGLTRGSIWTDRFLVGSLGLAYRRGPDWDRFDFTPLVEAPPPPAP